MLKNHFTKVLLASKKKYERTQKDFDDYKKMFEEHKFSMDSYGKAEYAKAWQMYADALEELQEKINECEYILSK